MSFWKKLEKETKRVIEQVEREVPRIGKQIETVVKEARDDILYDEEKDNLKAEISALNQTVEDLETALARKSELLRKRFDDRSLSRICFDRFSQQSDDFETIPEIDDFNPYVVPIKRTMRPVDEFEDFQTIRREFLEQKRVMGGAPQWIDADQPRVELVNKTVSWVTPHLLWPNITPRVFNFSFIRRNDDVVQGSYGDCWFLASLFALSPHDAIMLHPTQGIITANSDEVNGIFEFLFFDDQAALNSPSRIRKVCVDSLIPCVLNNGHYEPVGCTSKIAGVMWPILVEKAFAKLYGSYNILHGGYSSTAFENLTGCKSACYLRTTSLLNDADLLWTKMLAMWKNGFVFSLTWQWNKHKTLFTEHAYSVVDIFSHQGVRVVKLRNPWGHTPFDDSGHVSSLADEEESAVQSSNNGVFFLDIETVAEYIQQLHCVRAFANVRVTENS